jgi:hypothetical protein
MKRRPFLVGVSGLAILVAIGIYITQRSRGPADPPVIIVGGSIRSKSTKPWAQLVKGQKYKYKAKDDISIYTVGVFDASGNQPSQPIPAPNGFRIRLFDSLPDGVTQQTTAGVEVCSDTNCNVAKGDGSTVFIHILRNDGTAQLEEYSNTDLHFHSLYPDPKHPDPECDQQASGSDKGPCDHPSWINIEVAGSGALQYHKCGGYSPYGAGVCSIGIGGPPPNPTPDDPPK